MNIKYPDLNYKKVGIICMGLFVYAFIFAYGIFPPILKAILRSVSLGYHLKLNNLFNVYNNFAASNFKTWNSNA